MQHLVSRLWSPPGDPQSKIFRPISKRYKEIKTWHARPTQARGKFVPGDRLGAFDANPSVSSNRVEPEIN
jgi:hypothetical protein